MKLSPARLIFIWWALCLGLFLANWPVAYTRPHLGFVVALWASTFFCSIAAYRVATRPSAARRVQREHERIGRFATRIPKIGVVLSLGLLPLTVANYSGFSIGEFNVALADTASAYFATGETLTQGRATRTPFVVLLTLVNIFAITSLPYFTFEWFRHRTSGGWLLLSLLPYAALALFTGRDYYIGLPAAIVAVSGLAGSRGYLMLRKGGLLFAALFASAILWALAERRQDRSAFGRTNLTLQQCGPGTVCDGSEPGGLVGFLASYATQGFQGLGVARDATWNFGWLVSHSPPLTRLFGVDTSLTVSSQLDQLGWSSSGLWSTGLVKIANDVPWILVPVAVALLFALFGKLWLVSQPATVHPVTVTVLAYTGYLLLFMPQNLTLAIDGPRYFAYLGLTGWWIFHRLAFHQREKARQGAGNHLSGRATQTSAA